VRQAPQGRAVLERLCRDGDARPRARRQVERLGVDDGHGAHGIRRDLGEHLTRPGEGVDVHGLVGPPSRPHEQVVAGERPDRFLPVGQDHARGSRFLGASVEEHQLAGRAAQEHRPHGSQGHAEHLLESRVGRPEGAVGSDEARGRSGFLVPSAVRHEHDATPLREACRDAVVLQHHGSRGAVEEGQPLAHGQGDGGTCGEGGEVEGVDLLGCESHVRRPHLPACGRE